MTRVALTFVAAFAATTMAAPAFAQHHGAGMHRSHHGGPMARTWAPRPTMGYRTAYRARVWPGQRLRYGYRTAYRSPAYRHRPYALGAAAVAPLAAAAVYGTAYGYDSPYYYGSPYYRSVYSGGGLVGYRYPTYSAGYGAYAGYGGYGYSGCYRCAPVVYYRSCGCSAGW